MLGEVKFLHTTYSEYIGKGGFFVVAEAGCTPLTLPRLRCLPV